MRRNKILLICRQGDDWSNKIIKLLKKNFLNVTILYSETYKQKIDKKVMNWTGDYILSFRSLLILPEKIINNAKIAAINFHPGPPKYRGVGCLNYAVYNNEKYYGVTAHLMTKKIDYGNILKVQKFKIDKMKNLDQILEITHGKLYLIAKYFIDKIIKKKLDLKKLIKLNKYSWSKKIKLKSDLDKFYIINKNVSKKNLHNKLRATITKKFKPYILIHKRKFYVDDES